MQQAYRIIAAALGWFAIGLDYYLIVRHDTDGDLIAGAIRLLSYFTILSNILVALAMTLPWAAPELASRSLLPRSFGTDGDPRLHHHRRRDLSLPAGAAL